jgi:hypothetical protein
MANHNTNISTEFVQEFLKHYLKNGIGSMSKSDIDALVMHLLDSYSSFNNDKIPLNKMSNQAVSEKLKANITKIKKLRYDAGLKYAINSEEEAKKRFCLCLNKASFNFKDNKIHLIIEDQLAKNWIQGRLKEKGIFYDGAFNSEIINIDPEDFFSVLKILVDKKSVQEFKEKYEDLKKAKKGQELTEGFKNLAQDFVKEVLKNALSHLPSLIGLPTF